MVGMAEELPVYKRFWKGWWIFLPVFFGCNMYSMRPATAQWSILRSWRCCWQATAFTARSSWVGTLDVTHPIAGGNQFLRDRYCPLWFDVCTGSSKTSLNLFTFLNILTTAVSGGLLNMSFALKGFLQFFLLLYCSALFRILKCWLGHVDLKLLCVHQ
jgi:hypothetical protein